MPGSTYTPPDSIPGTTLEEASLFPLCSQRSEAQRGEVICPKSQSQEAAEWGPHSQASDSEDSVCFSGPVNILWELSSWQVSGAAQQGVGSTVGLGHGGER